MSTTATSPRPIVLPEGETIDTLTEVATVKVLTSDLRPGMLLVDAELGTPCAELDHRQKGGTRGNVTWLAEDLDTGRYFDARFGASLRPNVTVAAR